MIFSRFLAIAILLLLPIVLHAQTPKPGTRVSFQSGTTTVIEGYEGGLTKTSNGDVWIGFVDRPSNAELTKGNLDNFEFRPGNTLNFEYARRQGNRTPSYITVDLRVLRAESMTVRGVAHDVVVIEATVSSTRPVWNYRMQAWVDPKLRYMLRREILGMSDTTPNVPSALRANNILPPP
ncbi:MAG: hypothetical protein ING44_07885 [Telmatospirillum sp.]|nr:hypothetical protein [Telmatospirillum sp.]